MKLILDFDDVLFKNTPEFKDWMFSVIAEAGISREEEEAEYKKERAKGFSLRKFLIRRLGNDRLYEKVLSRCSEFVNKEIEKVVREIGKDNCYMVSHGDKDYQRDKIKKSGLTSLFKEIIIVLGSKKEAVEKICSEFPNEDKIVFIDDKEVYFDDIEKKEYPNLRTVLYKRGEPLEL